MPIHASLFGPERLHIELGCRTAGGRFLCLRRLSGRTSPSLELQELSKSCCVPGRPGGFPWLRAAIDDPPTLAEAQARAVREESGAARLPAPLHEAVAVATRSIRARPARS